MKHIDALLIAGGLVERLRPACTRIEIAGSIRRGKADVKDIEIVAIPDLTPMLRARPEFGKPIPKVHKTKLDAILDEMVAERMICFEKNGEKYKKFDFENRINCDLFLVTPPAEWGVQMVIRTGPADFSHWVVTRQRSGGALPNEYRVQDGAVWEGDTSNPTQNLIGFGEEIDFLKFLGLGWVEPGEREARWRK